MFDRKEYMKTWYEAHKEDQNAYHRAKRKTWGEERKNYEKAKKKAWREKHKEECRLYQKTDVNSLGKTKQNIRTKSQNILKQMNLHIDGYQIHHCFGYEDPAKFIYISKSLHLKIHQYLRDNNIKSDNNHWMQIRDLVNNSNEFIYIKC